jgi:iron-sulfur cluster repair protein YtfE (RIC family)
LLRDVGRRTALVLALAQARTWPAEELRALIRFLRTTVLRQVSDEERLLYPADHAAAPFAELGTDHLRLHLLTDQLDQVTASPCAPPELTALIQELLTTLQRHLIAEETVLAALPHAPQDAPGTAQLAPGSSPWSPGRATR